MKSKTKQLENIEISKKMIKDIGSFCLGRAKGTIYDLFALPTSLEQLDNIHKKFRKEGKLTAYEYGRSFGQLFSPFIIQVGNIAVLHDLFTNGHQTLGYALLGTEIGTNVVSAAYEIFKCYKMEKDKKHILSS